MRYHGYEVDAEFVKSGLSIPAWKGLGGFIYGKKGGVRWFIKRVNEYRFPTEKGEPDAEIRNALLAPAKAYLDGRVEIRNLLLEKGKLSKDKDHIVVPEKHFVADMRLVLVSRLVENRAEIDATSLSPESFINFCIDVISMIKKVHDCGVIHGDLKIGRPGEINNGNIIVTKESGKIVPYLVDFDMSYPAPPANNPESIPYSANYESPEEIPHIDDIKEEKTVITRSTDIFTLGIIFHHFWTGSFPATHVEKTSVGRCVAEDEKFTLNGKFDIKIGKNHNATLISLINWMLAKNPGERPTAHEILSVLTDKLAVPEAYRKGRDDSPYTGLWDMHSMMAETSREHLATKNIEIFRRAVSGGVHKYIVIYDNGNEEWLTIDDLLNRGYADRKGAAVSEPWEEHNIRFRYALRIAMMGYAKIERAVTDKNVYKITATSGLSYTHGPEWLISEGLASKKVVPMPTGDKPWEGDGDYADPEFLKERGVKKISRVMFGENKCYLVVYSDKEPLRNVSLNTMKHLRYIRD